MSELMEFQRFIAEKLQALTSEMSPEEALDLWRTEHPDRDEYVETVAALREALVDMERGDTGVPLRVFDTDFRDRHGIK